MSKNKASKTSHAPASDSQKKSGVGKFIFPLILAVGAAIAGFIIISDQSKTEPFGDSQSPAGERRKLDPARMRIDKTLSESGIAMKNGEFIKAGDVLHKHLVKFPNDEQVRIALIRYYIGVAQNSKQIAKLREIKTPLKLAMNSISVLLEKNPKHTEAIFSRGIVKNMQAEGSGDIDMLTAAEAQNANWTILQRYADYLWMKNDRELAKNYLESAYEKQGKTSPELTARLGKVYYDLCDLKKAYPLLEKAVKMFPNNANLRISLGDVLFDQGKYDLAITNFERASLNAVRGEAATVQSMLGRIYRKQKDWTKAARCYAKAATYDIDKALNSYNAAYCYHMQNRYAKAMHYIDQAYKIQPGNVKIARLRKKIEDKRFGKPVLDNSDDQGKSLLDLGKPKKPAETGDSTNTLMPIGK